MRKQTWNHSTTYFPRKFKPVLEILFQTKGSRNMSKEFYCYKSILSFKEIVNYFFLNANYRLDFC